MDGKRLLVTLILICAIASVGIFVGRWTLQSVGAEVEGYEELKVYTEALTLVEKNYVEEVEQKDLVYSSIKGMLNSLDPHSAFMTPEMYREMQVDTKGEFGGLGIQIGIKDGMLTVIAPLEDTPAFRAGIKAGDKILKINDELTKDMSLHDAVSKMRGVPKTSVRITIIREGWKETKDFTIVREIIKIKSVKSKLLDDRIGYIKLIQFQEQTAEDLSKAFKILEQENMNSLILDMRNNPGGLLNSAVDVSSFFLPADKLIVYIEDRDGKKVEYNSSGVEGSASDVELPMIVLVNEGSASASEIVAGALKDWSRAVVIGTSTFGKGSVQSVVPLSDGSALRLTTAMYYTPKGISIQTTGIIPDIVVKQVLKEGEQGRPIIREKDLEGHLQNGELFFEEEKTEMIPIKIDEENDTQLQRAIDLLKTWKVFKEIPKADQEAEVVTTQ